MPPRGRDAAIAKLFRCSDFGRAGAGGHAAGVGHARRAGSHLDPAGARVLTRRTLHSIGTPAISTTGEEPPMNINDLLKIAVERKASDLHLKVGSHPVIRVDGELLPLIELKRLMQEDTIAMAFSIMNARQKQLFKEEFEIDIAYSVPGLGRFRCNIFQQRGTVGLVLRVIPARILAIRELMLPPVLERVCDETRGLVLCTGTTGSGKSTSLAAMIDYINNLRTDHIITIEDPIEFLHRDKKAIVNQREISSDTRDFAKALRSALRQDPDVILVGEMRDYETIETALLAAETGHLVFSTLHTLDATETINRIIAVFPPHHQKQIRIQLGQVLRAVISLRLMPRADGMGRVPAVEVMRVTPYIRECIENKDKTKYIREQIALGTSQYGMQTFDQSLFSLYKAGLITLEEALKRATNPDEFKLKIQGIQSTSDMAAEEMEKTMQSFDVET
jgi:twitching motility protein PilT